MPTFTIAKQLRVGTVTTPIVDPVPVLSQLSIATVMDAADVVNPATDVRATLEWAPSGSSAFVLCAEARLIGDPSNRVDLTPAVVLSPALLGFLVGQRLRGSVTSATPLQLGATVVIT